VADAAEAEEDVGEVVVTIIVVVAFVVAVVEEIEAVVTMIMVEDFPVDAEEVEAVAVAAVLPHPEETRFSSKCFVRSSACKDVVKDQYG